MEPIWWLARVLAYPLRLAFRIRRVGSQHVARHGPVLLAANHVSFLDPLALLWLGERTGRRVRFVAMAELWRSRFLRFFLVHTHQIPIVRSSRESLAALGLAARALAQGECVCVFPEGSISADLELLPGRTGVAYLAAATGVPVTPVGLWGGQRISTRGRPPKWRLGVALSIVTGPPVAVRPGEDPYEATDRVMAAIAGCVAEARRIYPQRPRGRDDGWWVRSPATAVARPSRPERTGAVRSDLLEGAVEDADGLLLPDAPPQVDPP